MKSWSWSLIFTLLVSGADLVAPVLKGEASSPRAVSASEQRCAVVQSSAVQSPATFVQEFEDTDESGKALLPSAFVHSRFCQLASEIVAQRALVYFGLIRLALSSSRAPPRVA